MRCEICDREPCDVPDGQPRGWLVAYFPARRWYRAGPGRSFAAAMAACGDRLPVGHRVFTCGGAICVMRAANHGVPGSHYPTGVDAIDEWIEANPGSY